MKPSPLRLNWVTYPSASYDIGDEFDEDSVGDKLVVGDIQATVKYQEGDTHFAFIQIRSKEGAPTPYKFSVSAVASFTFDLEIARREYRPALTRNLVPTIAVNVCRILYAGAREYLAMVTSRATHGTAVLESVLLEPNDVSIESDLQPPELIQKVFGATVEEVEEMRRIVEEKTAETSMRTEKSKARIKKKA